MTTDDKSGDPDSDVPINLISYVDKAEHYKLFKQLELLTTFHIHPTV